MIDKDAQPPGWHEMQQPYDQISSKALGLSPRQRVRLAQELLCSLEDSSDADAESAWAVEIARRLEDLHEGRVVTVDAEVAFRTARQSLVR